MARKPKLAQVVSLAGSKGWLAPGAREMLANITRAAEEAGFTGIAIAATDRAGYTHTAYCGGDNIATLIGAVERVKYRLLQHQDGS